MDRKFLTPSDPITPELALLLRRPSFLDDKYRTREFPLAPSVISTFYYTDWRKDCVWTDKVMDGPKASQQLSDIQKDS
ncbi:hypothetical protein AVEN_209829-1 [Araneus ventricosus]|uniref:Uncharacterized protein n=1 Tax=Araneus ventricosus TaxID=182803 RepID=A0A4Y2G083_ARAVE|nr:hypothetical protein AVEN_209829-1 [Araneus ventricosus]